MFQKYNRQTTKYAEQLNARVDGLAGILKLEYVKIVFYPCAVSSKHSGTGTNPVSASRSPLPETDNHIFTGYSGLWRTRRCMWD